MKHEKRAIIDVSPCMEESATPDEGFGRYVRDGNFFHTFSFFSDSFHGPQRRITQFGGAFRPREKLCDFSEFSAMFVRAGRSSLGGLIDGRLFWVFVENRLGLVVVDFFMLDWMGFVCG